MNRDPAAAPRQQIVTRFTARGASSMADGGGQTLGESMDAAGGNTGDQEAFERMLSANLARVVDLIKFAETKNAALLTFSAFWILALINLLASGRAMPDGFPEAFLLALPVFAISAFVCVLAFLPKIDLQHRHIANESYKNLLFFSDIAQVALADYEEAARARYFPTPGAPAPAYLRDLAREVAVNARIADRKFRLFHWAARIMSLAIATLVAPGLWHLAMWIAG
jgi:hypothetical protein